MDKGKGKSIETGSAGHRRRLRKRFLENGLDSFHDYEKLELLLTFVIPRRDVKPIAKELIMRFGNICGIIDAPIEELCKVPGLAENSAILCKLIKAMTVHYLGEEMKCCDVLLHPERVADFARAKIGALAAEAVLVIYLNVKNMVISTEINHGTVDQAVVYPRMLMQSALRCNAVGLILVHNHPSGDCQPSAADEKLTDAVNEAARTMNIKLIDHLIVSRSAYYSFAQSRKL